MHVPKQNKMAGKVSQERVNETVSQDVELQIFFFNDMKWYLCWLNGYLEFAVLKAQRVTFIQICWHELQFKSTYVACDFR